MNTTPIYTVKAGTQVWVQKADKPGLPPISVQLPTTMLFDGSQILLSPVTQHVSEYFLFWDGASVAFLWVPLDFVIMAEVLVGG